MLNRCGLYTELTGEKPSASLLVEITQEKIDLLTHFNNITKMLANVSTRALIMNIRKDTTRYLNIISMKPYKCLDIEHRNL